MLKLFRDQKGFTLVELMIVVVIVGILAAVAIPMYRGSAKHARASEAVAALGSIRSAMRVYNAEHGTYVNAAFVDGAPIDTAGVLDLTSDDLEGTYFSRECYTFNSAPAAAAFSIECDGSQSTTAEVANVVTIGRRIDQAGTITRFTP